ncbi:MAG: ferrous iron transport protein A [Thermoplasmatales archaeon]|nr:ferrous iron transport protein A [Thermoplasmatales archaeon]
MPLVDLEPEKEGIIACIEGGFGLKRRVRSIGLREGKNLRVIASHPFSTVVGVDGREIGFSS